MTSTSTLDIAKELKQCARRLEHLAGLLVAHHNGSAAPETVNQVIPYSQFDPRWAGEVYAGGWTFASGGCYTVCVNYAAQSVGYADTPPDTAQKLNDAGAYVGANLSHPERIPIAYPLLEWPADAYYNRPGDQLSLSVKSRVDLHIATYGWLILKVDYKPENYKYDMHFVFACGFDDVGRIVILDPLTGKLDILLSAYGTSRGWSERQAIFGYRGLRPK